MGLIEVKKEEASNSEDSYDADSESGECQHVLVYIGKLVNLERVEY